MATREERRQLNKHWLRKLLRGEPHILIGGDENPYLRRWFLIPRNGLLNIYLHHFLRSDDDRALHDHPWHFLSFVLKGGYWEHRRDKLITSKSWRPAGSIGFRKADTLHRVELEWLAQNPRETSAWTIVITGPKLREWGFACAKRWVPWTYFDYMNGCGEYA